MVNKLTHIHYEQDDENPFVRYAEYPDGTVEAQFKHDSNFPITIFEIEDDQVYYVTSVANAEEADDEVAYLSDKNPNAEYEVDDYSDKPTGWYTFDTVG